MNYKELIKETVEQQGYILSTSLVGVGEREVRRSISELRKEGFILIPMEKGCYVHADRLDQATINNFYQAQVAHLKKQYFNTVLPLARKVKDNQLIELMGGFDEIR